MRVRKVVEEMVVTSAAAMVPLEEEESFSNPSTIKSSSDKEATILQWTTVGLGALLAYCCESQLETPFVVFLRCSFVGLILLPQACTPTPLRGGSAVQAYYLLGIRCITLVCHAHSVVKEKLLKKARSKFRVPFVENCGFL